MGLARAELQQPARVHVREAAHQVTARQRQAPRHRLRGVGRPVARAARGTAHQAAHLAQRFAACGAGRQHGLRQQPRVQRGVVHVAGAQRVEHLLAQAMAQPAVGAVERFAVGQFVFRPGQPQREPLREEMPGRIGQGAEQRCARELRHAFGRRRHRQHLRHEGRQRLALPAGRFGRRAPGAVETDAARGIGRRFARIHDGAKRLRREGLQRVAHQQAPGRIVGVGEIARRHVHQLRHHHRRRLGVAAARIAAHEAEVEHLPGRGQQLQEQEAVVFAHRAVAHLPARRAQRGGEAVERAAGVAARVVAVVHAQQADHLEGNQAHRNHAAEGDAAAEEGLAVVAFRQARLQPGAHHGGRHGRVEFGGHQLFRQRAHVGAQRFDGARVGGVLRAVGQQVVERGGQQARPVQRRARRGQVARQPLQHAQPGQQAVERGQVATLQAQQRRHAFDVAFVGAGVAEQQSIDGPLPGVGVFIRRAAGHAVRGVAAPACAGLGQRFAQAVDQRGREAQPLRHRRRRQQRQPLGQREARARQAQHAQEPVGQRLPRQRAAVGHGVGQRARRVHRRAEHGVHQRRVGVHVGREHGDVARLQLRVGVQQRAQLVVQHLHFAQRRVAGVQLQAAVGRVERAHRRGRRRAARQQVALQGLQQSVLVGFGIGGEFAAGLHHVAGEQQVDEIAAGGTVGHQQRMVGVLREHAGQVGAQPFARARQVAPPAVDRRDEEEVQRPRQRRRSDDAQHVGRHVLAGEREQPRRQARGRHGRGAVEALQVGVEPARAVRLAAGGAPPQLGLPVVRVGAAVPAQQPAAAPGLVFLEGVGHFARQRPRRQRAVGAGQHRLQRREHRRLHRGLIGQQRPQAPAQRVGIGQGGVAAGQVGRQRLADEFTRGEEAQVGGDAVFFRQRFLQPAAHGRLRYQDGVGLQHRRAGLGQGQLRRQQLRQQVQVVAVVEAEVGRGGHGPMMPHPRPTG